METVSKRIVNKSDKSETQSNKLIIMLSKFMQLTLRIGKICNNLFFFFGLRISCKIFKQN